ncbi:MAG: hypothetical protein ABH822_01515 [Patescibacteria group bacterium]
MAELTIHDAVEILGETKVITSRQAASILPPGKASLPVTNNHIPYTRDRLVLEADNNTIGTDNRLVYHFGLSLWEWLGILGDDSHIATNIKYDLSDKAHFDKRHGFWTAPTERYWATKVSPAGFYLVNFKGCWGRKTWAEQEKEIANFSGDYYLRLHTRAPEDVVVQAVFAICKTHGERLLQDWSHWGPSRDSLGRRVSVGNFNPGMVVKSESPSWNCRDNLRACLWQRPASDIVSQ